MDPEGEFVSGVELLGVYLCTFAATVAGMKKLLSGFATITSLIIEGFERTSYGIWKVDLGIGK